MKRPLLGLVLLLATACASTGNSDGMERPTYEADGRVYSVTDCPSAPNLIIGGYDAADGLPKKGQTDQNRVEALLPDAQEFYSEPKVVAVSVIRRNGEVWNGPGDGDYTVEKVDDYQYEILLAPDGRCPPSPRSFNGIPLLYNRVSE